MLTDRTKIEFDKWYNTKYFPIDHNATKGYSTSIINKGSISLGRFAYIPFEMQYGIYIEFFDSVGIKIFIDPSHIKNDYYATVNEYSLKYYDTRHEAIAVAIQKANEIYNNLNN